MKKELITAILLLAKSLGAYADDQAPIRISDIPKEVQQCMIISSNPENRELVKMTLDPDCAMNLSDEDQQKAVDVIGAMNRVHPQGGPMVIR